MGKKRSSADIAGKNETKEISSGKIATDNRDIFSQLWKSYRETRQSLKLIDAYLVFVMMTGVVQMLYVVLVGQYPYNSFLASFCTSVGSFVLAANLRIQLNPENNMQISPQRAYADFCFASLVLYAFAICFVG